MLFTEEQLKKLPEIYAQDGSGDESKVYVVVELQGFIWLLTEFDGADLFFGFVCLNDPQNAELGYISKQELEDLSKQYPLTLEVVEMSLKDAKAKYIK